MMLMSGLSRLAGTSEVYKGALIRPQAGVPAVFAVKLSVDKSVNDPFRAALWKRHNLTEARLYSFFEREKMLLATCGSHPNVVTPLLALSDPELVGGHDIIVTELGCLDVGSLQEVRRPASKMWDEGLDRLMLGSGRRKALPGQKLPLEVIKYVAAQAASACRHIHRNHFAWLDPRLVNVIITKGVCAMPATSSVAQPAAEADAASTPDFRCQLVDFAMWWHLPKSHDSIYFGAFLLYHPIVSPGPRRKARRC